MLLFIIFCISTLGISFSYKGKKVYCVYWVAKDLFHGRLTWSKQTWMFPWVQKDITAISTICWEGSLMLVQAHWWDQLVDSSHLNLCKWVESLEVLNLTIQFSIVQKSMAFSFVTKTRKITKILSYFTVAKDMCGRLNLTIRCLEERIAQDSYSRGQS
jgi:hypothetical protein